MAPGRRLFLAILTLVLLPAVAAAQVIPSGAQPGRERQQIAPPVQGPRAQPGGPAISLPSTVAPPGAESVMLTVSRIVITGATVYGDADFAPLYADLVGHEVPLAAVYELARLLCTLPPPPRPPPPPSPTPPAASRQNMARPATSCRARSSRRRTSAA